MIEALIYKGNRFVYAWLMAKATYLYTRSYDGVEVNAAGDTISFGRWYSFCVALKVGMGSMWTRSPKL